MISITTMSVFSFYIRSCVCHR